MYSEKSFKISITGRNCMFIPWTRNVPRLILNHIPHIFGHTYL